MTGTDTHPVEPRSRGFSAFGFSHDSGLVGPGFSAKPNSEKPRERGSNSDLRVRVTRRERRAYYRSAASPVNGAPAAPLFAVLFFQ